MCLSLCPLVFLYHSLKHWDKFAGHAPSGVADSAFSVTEQHLAHQSRQMPALPISLELFQNGLFFCADRWALIHSPPNIKGHQETIWEQSTDLFLYCQYSGKRFAWELNFEISHVSLY